jgi:hypothetical protein
MKKEVTQAGKKFKNEMQNLVNKSEGIDKISISSPSFEEGKEIVIAEKKSQQKKEKAVQNYSGDVKFNFTSPLHLACAKDNLRPVMECIHFINGFAYASDAHIMVKQSLELHTILNPEMLEGKSIHKKSYEQICTYDIVQACDDYILCKGEGREAEFMYSECGKPPNFEAVIPIDPIKGIEYLGINPKMVAIAGKILHGSDMGVRMTFRGGRKAVILTTEEYSNQLVLIMPIALEPCLF